MQDFHIRKRKPGPLASILSIFGTTLGRKYIMGVTGLSLVGFVVMHLIGNVTIFMGREALLDYAHKMESLGPFLPIIEAGLLGVFVFHAVFAIAVTRQNHRARSVRYEQVHSAGGASRKTFASLSMIFTGVILLAFLFWHIWMFRVQKSISDKDLYTLVVEAFKNPWITATYMGVMITLGIHISHGFWSGVQSLGLYHKRATPLIYLLGVLVAIALALGFLAIPPYIYFFVELTPPV
jgi:succinate dehydrogenase / fumarate reductase cytochrome b subunit